MAYINGKQILFSPQVTVNELPQPSDWEYFSENAPTYADSTVAFSGDWRAGVIFAASGEYKDFNTLDASGDWFVVDGGDIWSKETSGALRRKIGWSETYYRFGLAETTKNEIALKYTAPKSGVVCIKFGTLVSGGQIARMRIMKNAKAVHINGEESVQIGAGTEFDTAEKLASALKNVRESVFAGDEITFAFGIVSGAIDECFCEPVVGYAEVTESGIDETMLVGMFDGTKTGVDVVIPRGATEIRNYCFYHHKGIKSVEIPDSVTIVRMYAFSECSALESVDMSKTSITKFEQYVFYKCSNLQNVKLPKSLVTMAMHAFSECSALESVEIPDSVTSIGKYAFYRCTGLKNIHISANLAVIPEACFQNCEALTEIVIPSNITKIDSSAFAYCNALTSVVFKGTPATIGTSAFSTFHPFDIYVPWAEGAVSGAPWGAYYATIHYNYTAN